MNRNLMLLIGIVLVTAIGLVACSPAATAAPASAPAVNTAPQNTAAPAQPAASGAKPIIAVSLPALDNPLMLGFQSAFQAKFGSQYDVQVASADGNANTQASQIQNFTAMNVKFIFVMPVESTSLVPNLIAARTAGALVLAAGGDPGNADAYDSCMLTNQFLAGFYEAYMAKQWIDANYPEAPDGSLETAILQSTLNPDAVNRDTGMKMISEPYLKDVSGNYIDLNGKQVSDADKVANPAYSSKVKIVQTAEAAMFQDGQTAMQNVLTTNPNVTIVLAYSGDGAMGASQAIEDEYAKGAGVSVVKDLSKMGVFGVGAIGAEETTVADSVTNKSVFRGTIQFGGDLVTRTVNIADDMLNGKVTKMIYDPLDIIDIINGKLMDTPITNSEYFVIPTAAPQPVILNAPPGGGTLPTLAPGSTLPPLPGAPTATP